MQSDGVQTPRSLCVNRNSSITFNPNRLTDSHCPTTSLKSATGGGVIALSTSKTRSQMVHEVTHGAGKADVNADYELGPVLGAYFPLRRPASAGVRSAPARTVPAPRASFCHVLGSLDAAAPRKRRHRSHPPL